MQGRVYNCVNKKANFQAIIYEVITNHLKYG